MEYEVEVDGEGLEGPPSVLSETEDVEEVPKVQAFVQINKEEAWEEDSATRETKCR